MYTAERELEQEFERVTEMNKAMRSLAVAALIFGVTSIVNGAYAQDVRYSWLEFGVLGQDIDRSATSFDPILNQSVDIDVTDGNGLKFRGSVGTWKNFYAFFDFTTADPDVDAVVTNDQGTFPASDTFDFTTVRGGIGYKYSVGYKTDIIAEVNLDSVDYDFGSFAGEDFDLNEKDVGGLLGVRSMLNDDIEVRGHVRYTNLGDVDLTNRVFDSDVLYGVGIGYSLIRGLVITADYEAGEVSTWSVGFRLDLDED